MLTNPYNPSGTKWSDNHLVQGRVSQEDFFWVKGKFAFGCTGIIDKIIANLFKRFVDELRQIDRETPLDSAWCIDHETYRVLDDIFARLTFVERRPSGSYSIGGTATPQHDSGGTDGIRPEVQPPAFIGPVEKGSHATRKRRVKDTKEKEVKRRTRDGTPRKAS